MVDLAQRIHPYENRVFGGNGISLTPLENCERISLRAEEKAVAGLSKAIGTTLPRKPGTTSSKGDISALWIGPDEWFVTAATGTKLEAKINAVTIGLFSAVSIDHRNTGLTISGVNATLALNSGCARDLSLEAFPVETASRTTLGKAEIILWRTGKQEYRVECWRSFSDYVWKYLVDAARNV